MKHLNKVRRFRLVALLFIAISVSSCATLSESDLQILKIEPSGLHYENVVPVEGVNSAQLYDRAMAWMARTYHSANTVIQLQDRENKRIIGKGVFVVPFLAITIPVQHTISFEARDGRYKLRFDGLNAVPKTGEPWELSRAQGIQTQIVSATEKQIMALAADLQHSIERVTTEENKW